MDFAPQLLLLSSVIAVGVLHTMVPDHWVPITLLARQNKWSRSHTAKTAFLAGVGHVTSTLLIAALVWGAGVAVASSFGHLVDVIASIALVLFGGWIAISSWLEVNGHSHEEHHDEVHEHSHDGHSHYEHHDHKTSQRTGLLLILGASPMVEGIPAFFAAGKYGVGLVLLMAALFAVSTIATYVVLCVYSADGLRRIEFPAFERYGEVISGAFIALIGLVFFIWPAL